MRERQRRGHCSVEGPWANEGEPSPARSTAEVLRRIEADPALQRLLQLVRVLRPDASAEPEVEPADELSHGLRVALWTLRLGGTNVDSREAIGAALLHEAVPRSTAVPEGAEASVRSAKLAREVLAGAGFRPKAIVRVSEAIEDHRSETGRVPRSALGRSLQDAHRLDALGAFGVLRAASWGARHGAMYFDIADPWARMRPADGMRLTIDQLIVRLERLGPTLQTPAGRAEAQRREAFLRCFLNEVGEELGEPDAFGPAAGASSPPLRSERRARAARVSVPVDKGSHRRQGA